MFVSATSWGAALSRRTLAAILVSSVLAGRFLSGPHPSLPSVRVRNCRDFNPVCPKFAPTFPDSRQVRTLRVALRLDAAPTRVVVVNADGACSEAAVELRSPTQHGGT